MSLGVQLNRAIQDLINTTGTQVTFRRTPVGSYNPSTGSSTPSANQDEQVRVAFVNYGINEVDGSNVVRGDRKVLMNTYQTDGSNLSKSPTPGDLFVGEGDTVRVISVFTTKVNETIVGYICQVRE